jgi:hypothetical protein
VDGKSSTKQFCERHFIVKTLPTTKIRKSVANENSRKEKALFTGGWPDCEVCSLENCLKSMHQTGLINCCVISFISWVGSFSVTGIFMLLY